MTTTTSPITSPSAHAHSGPSTARKIVAILVMLVGVVLIAMTFMNNLFKVGPAFEDLITDFRPLLKQESLDAARADLAGLQAVGTEFQAKVSPAMAQQLGMTQEQFAAMVEQNFPAVSEGLTAIPEAVPTMNGLLDTLEQQRPLFESADAIPTSDLPATTVPWIMLISGIAALGAGVLIWFMRRTGPAVALGLGVALAVTPLMLSLPQKAADADELNANLKPVYTAALVQSAKTTAATMGAMGEQMTSEMLPALAVQLKMAPEDLQAMMAENFPATSAALAGFEEVMQRFESLVTPFEENLVNYDVLVDVTFVPIIWTLIGSGVALIVLGGAGLFIGMRVEQRA